MGFIADIKAIPITDFAERMGYTLKRLGSRYYTLREHDSVRISIEKNAFWRNSKFQQGEKGSAGSVIDFAIEFCGYDRKEAIRELARMYNIRSDPLDGIEHHKTELKQGGIKRAENPIAVNEEKKILNLPPRAADNKAIFRYLCRVRNIDISVIRYFLAKGYLYQDDHNNCVFKTDKFACKRSTGGKKFAIDVEGCDYDECFFIRPSDKANTLIVAESVIDIMSIMSQIAREGKRYTNYSYLALAGVNKLPSLFIHLLKDRGFNAVILGMDNDEFGERATRIAETGLIEYGFNGRYAVAAAPSGKDWNEYIQSQRGVDTVNFVLSAILNQLAV